MKIYVWILIVLILFISIYYMCKTCYKNKSTSKKLFKNTEIEGFEYSIDGLTVARFNNAKEPQIYIPQYSADSERLLTLLYDRFYFDELNGNLVEIVPTDDGVCELDDDCENDDTGTTISQIIIMSRLSELKKYPTTLDDDDNVLPVDTDESQTDTVSAIPQPMCNNYVSRDKQYQILYFAIGTMSYVHVLLSKDGKYGNICTYVFGTDNSVEPIMYENISKNVPTRKSVISTKDLVIPDEDVAYETDKKDVFYITEDIYMNMSNQTVVVYSGSDTYVYPVNGGGTTATDIPADVKKGNLIDKFTSWTVNDSAGNMILLISYLNNIIVGVYSKVNLPDTDECISISDFKNLKCMSSFDIQTNTPTIIQQVIISNRYDNVSSISLTNAPIVSSKSNTNNNVMNSPTPTSYNFNDLNFNLETLPPSTNIEICGDDELCKRYVNFYKKEMNIRDSEDYIRKSEIIPGITDNGKYMNSCGATPEPIDYCASKAKSNATTNIITDATRHATDNKHTTVPTKTSSGDKDDKHSLDDLLDKLSDKLSDASSEVSEKMKKLADYLSKEDELSTPRPNKSSGDTSAMNTGKDMYSYFGALSNKGESDFIPVNSDFSAFRH